MNHSGRDYRKFSIEVGEDKNETMSSEYYRTTGFVNSNQMCSSLKTFKSSK